MESDNTRYVFFFPVCKHGAEGTLPGYTTRATHSSGCGSVRVRRQSWHAQPWLTCTFVGLQTGGPADRFLRSTHSKHYITSSYNEYCVTYPVRPVITCLSHEGQERKCDCCCSSHGHFPAENNSDFLHTCTISFSFFFSPPPSNLQIHTSCAHTAVSSARGHEHVGRHSLTANTDIVRKFRCRPRPKQATRQQHPGQASQQAADVILQPSPLQLADDTPSRVRCHVPPSVCLSGSSQRRAGHGRRQRLAQHGKQTDSMCVSRGGSRLGC